MKTQCNPKQLHWNLLLRSDVPKLQMVQIAASLALVSTVIPRSTKEVYEEAIKQLTKGRESVRIKKILQKIARKIRATARFRRSAHRVDTGLGKDGRPFQ